jgi:hypothetical protein
MFISLWSCCTTPAFDIYHILWREMGNNTIGQQVIDDDDENVEYFMYIKNSLE